VSEPRDIVRQQIRDAAEEIFRQLDAMKLLFQNPDYDLNKTVENELDFYLGAVMMGMLERCTFKLVTRAIRPTPQEIIWMNRSVFSRAPEAKELIKQLLGV